VICPNCSHENKRKDRFCINCGTPLSKPPTDTNPANLDENVKTLQNEVVNLSQHIIALTNRVQTLERLTRKDVATSSTQPTASATPPTSPNIQGIPHVPKSPSRSQKSWDWEQVLGGNWLARIGVLALIIGVAFFLKLAFDNDWIGPNGRIILGFLGGLVLLGGGQYWHKRYPLYAQAITGGGVALFYVTTFAAHAIYGMLTPYLASGFLLLVSVVSSGLAIRYESRSLAIIGILGAFIGPFAIGGEEFSGPWILIYIMIVNIAVLALCTFRNWRWFTLLALLGSLAHFVAWRVGSEEEMSSLLVSQGSWTIIFLLFIGATTLFHIIWRRTPKIFDHVLMVLNAALYFGISCALLWDEFRNWMGGFSLTLALFYGGIAYAALMRSKENAHLSFFILSTALVFLTVAIPIQLGDSAWLTIVWAAQGTIFFWAAFAVKMPYLRAFGYIMFFITSIRLIFFDTTIDLLTFQPVLNERFLAFAVSIAAMYITAYMLRRGRGSLFKIERRIWSVYPIFVAMAGFFSLWILTAEAFNYFDRRSLYRPEAFALTNAKQLSITALWAFYSGIMLVVGIVRQKRAVRIGGLALLAVPVAKVFVYDVWAMDQVYRVVAFVGLGVLLLVGGYLYQRYSLAIRGFLSEK
jgi:uncharacterized membrane protein